MAVTWKDIKKDKDITFVDHGNFFYLDSTSRVFMINGSHSVSSAQKSDLLNDYSYGLYACEGYCDGITDCVPYWERKKGYVK